MSAAGLVPRTFAIPLAKGLQQRTDPRALEAPGMTLLRDGEFDELGGIRTRYDYSAGISTNILGGGTIADCRRIVDNGGELLCFTETGLYSYNTALSQWVLKGTHLAVKVDEQTVFAATGDQIDCDRAEMSSTVVYTWCDTNVIYVAAWDKTTRSVALSPRAITAGSGAGTRPRLVALTTRILLFWHNGTDAAPDDLLVLAIDPSDVATSITSGATTALASPNFGSYYDVCKVAGQDQAVFACRRVTTTSYTVGTVTAGLTVATSTKARTCAMPIAVSVTLDGSVQVVRSDAGALLGDLITISTLADVGVASTGVSIGTYSSQLNQLAACHRSAKDSGQYRCYVFWSYNEAENATNWTSASNWINDGATPATGTEANFVRRMGIASRAFDYDGRVYVWGTFASASSFTGANKVGFRASPQNSYFLYRENDNPSEPPLLIAKAAYLRGGGFNPAIGHLPGVALTSGSTSFSWCATEKRIISVGVKQRSYADRGPRDVTFTFDSNEARRCVRLGETLYITGGEILQYDGARLVEVGYHVNPWWFAPVETNGSGSVADGTFAYKVSPRYANAKGEVDRGTSMTVGEVTLSGGGAQGVTITPVPLYITHKIPSTTQPALTPAIEIWRTAVNPTFDAPFFLVTSQDPAVSTYRANDITASTLTALLDTSADATITVLTPNHENGGQLENLAPPAATLIAASADRVFLAGVAGDPDRVWYSKLRGEGEVASFTDTLTFLVPRAGGAITAIAFLGETLIVSRETALYAVSGEGLDNVGGGSNYVARRIAGDVGAVSAEAIAETPFGLMFQTLKGWHVLTEGGSVEYIGAPVYDSDTYDVSAVHVVKDWHQVRCVVTETRVLVFDYLVKEWAEWTIDDGVHAANWQGDYHYLTEDGPMTESDNSYGGYGLDVETGWIVLGQVQGFGRIWALNVLGTQQAGLGVRVRLARDYDDDYFQDKTYNDGGDPLQFKHGPSIQEMQAIKIRITAVDPDDDEEPPSDAGMKLTSLGVELGLERGLKRLPAEQQQ